MRPVQQSNMNKQRPRGRGRGGSGGKPHSGGGNQGGNQGGVVNLNRTLDSNGPDVKIRGTVAHIFEKYQNLARDANSQGDHVGAENYLQHAEHYYRLLAAANQAQAATRERDTIRQNGSRRLGKPENSQETGEHASESGNDESRGGNSNQDSPAETSFEENLSGTA